MAAIIEDDGFEQGGMEWEGDWWTEEFVGTVEEFAMLVGTEPETIQEALSRETEAEAWSEAVKAEIRQCEEKETWDIVEALPDTNIVACRYTFRYKLDPVGAIVKYKARLVAKGFTQKDLRKFTAWISSRQELGWSDGRH
jgi:hypothetical protein